MLSNIASASGFDIQPLAWKGSAHNIRQQSTQWPKQPRPSENAWKIWRLVLRTLFDLNEQCFLPHSIDTWDDNAQDWRWWHRPSDNRLYEFIENQIYFQLEHTKAFYPACHLWEHCNSVEHKNNELVAVNADDQQIAAEFKTGFHDISEQKLSNYEEEKLVHTATLSYKLAWITNTTAAQARAVRR
jgi:hypothetical protein